MDPKTKKVVEDWRWLLRKAEIEAIVTWWDQTQTVDAAYFAKHPSLVAVPRNDRTRQTLIDFMIGGKIPRHHFEGLRRICFESLLYSDHSLLGNPGLWGLYHRRNKLIVLNDGLKCNLDGLRTTVFHEIGHHAEHVLELDLPNARKIFKQLQAVSPRQFRNWSEFFAVLYEWSYAGGSERDHWSSVFKTKIDPGIFRVKKKV